MLPSTHTPRTPWYRTRRGVLIAAGLLALSVLVVVLSWWIHKKLYPPGGDNPAGLGCSSSERAVLEEFPHYGDQHFEPFDGEVSCIVRYAANARRPEVLSYYEERWRENSWERSGSAPPVVVACRGGYGYAFEYSSQSGPMAGARFSPGGYPEESSDENEVKAVVTIEVSNSQPSPHCPN